MAYYCNNRGKARAIGLRHGFRSGFEKDFSDDLKERGVTFEFEPHKIKYSKPITHHTYTPDFMITTKTGKTIYAETKGRWMSEDRKKHIFVRDCNPELDIRFVFQNPNSKLSKKSPTTYAKWCEKNGFKWAKKVVPDEWLME